jgi:hypothetical protein
MIVDKIRISFVNLKTGIEKDIIDIDINGVYAHDSQEIEETVDQLRSKLFDYETFYIHRKDNKAVIFNNEALMKIGFLKIEPIEKSS